MAKKKATSSVNVAYRSKREITADQILHLEQDFLQRAEAFPKLSVSADDCLQHARDYAAKAKSDSKLQGHYVSLACFYYYFAKYQYLVPEANKELEQLLGEWASRAGLSNEKKLLTKATKLKKNEARKLSNLVAACLVGYSTNFLFSDINTSLALIPDDLFYAVHVLYKSGYDPAAGLGLDLGFDFGFNFDFDEEKPHEESEFLSLSHFQGGLRQGLNNSQEETMCTLFVDFLDRVEHEVDEVCEHIKENIGLPSETAFMIAMAYLEGNGIVEPDRRYAYAFLKYAMLTGSPRACLAWAVFGETFGTDIIADDTSLLECYCNTLTHGFLLCRFDLKCVDDEVLLALRNAQLPLYEAQGRNDISLNIGLSLTSALIRLYRKTSCSTELLSKIMPFIAVISELSVKLERNYFGQMAIRCCIARMVTIIGDSPNLGEEVRMIVGMYTKVQENASKARMAIELIKPYLNKKEAIVDQTLLDLDPVGKDAQVQKAYLRLATQGSPDAFFKLASIGRMAPGNKLFESGIFNSAATGHPAACYNAYVFLSQIKNCDEKNGEETGEENGKEKKLHYLKQAVLSGVPQAYFSLFTEYETEKGINREIGDTCLRYAAEYLCPKAASFLNNKRFCHKYKPLPFIRVLEEIEQLAQSQSTAAVFLGALYDRGVIVPQDQLKSQFWYRKAVELGDTVSIEKLLNLYAENGVSKVQHCLIGSMQHNLELRDAFPVPADLEDDRQEDMSYVGNLYETLKKGKSWLEKHIFAQVHDADLWHIMGVSTQNREEITDKHRQAYAQTAMLDACRIYASNYVDYEPLFGDEVSHDAETLLSDLELVKYSSLHTDLSDYLCNYKDLLMFLSLRGSCSLDIKQTQKFIEDSYKANNLVASVLSRVNLEALSLKGTEAEIKTEDPNKSSKKKVQGNKQYFDVSVEQ